MATKMVRVAATVRPYTQQASKKRKKAVRNVYHTPTRPTSPSLKKDTRSSQKSTLTHGTSHLHISNQSQPMVFFGNFLKSVLNSLYFVIWIKCAYA